MFPYGYPGPLGKQQPKREPLPDAGLFPGYLTGWRIWKIDRNHETGDLRLQSPFYHVEWEPRVRMDAICKTAEKHNPAPCEKHETNTIGCGIYCYAEREPAYAEVSGAYKNYGVVLGEVAVWGRVIRHDRGFRGSHAYPVSFVAFRSAEKQPVDEGMVREVAAIYAIDQPGELPEVK